MYREHCESADSQNDFKTSNYALTTTSEKEWWFVVDPVRGIDKFGGQFPVEFPDDEVKRSYMRTEDRARKAIPLATFTDKLRAINAQLESNGYLKVLDEEMIAARL